MVCFAISVYTFDADASPTERLFCDNFEDFVNKIRQYVPPTSRITIDGNRVEVSTSYPCIMHHLLPQANFTSINADNLPWMEENKEILTDCIDRRVSLGGLEMFVSAKFNKNLTNKEATQLLSTCKDKVTHMYICSEKQDSANIYFIMSGHMFHIYNNSVSDWGGFGYDLQDGFYRTFGPSIPVKMRKQQEEFIERGMTGPS